jgi:hypothetical protein
VAAFPFSGLSRADADLLQPLFHRQPVVDTLVAGDRDVVARAAWMHSKVSAGDTGEDTPEDIQEDAREDLELDIRRDVAEDIQGDIR